jgi:hypothetical protein
MMNVLLWWIGVVSNYNTRTGKVKRFGNQIDPTEVMVAVAPLAVREKVK